MANTRKHIKSLTGGVSEQPDAERKDSQGTLQENFLSDPIRGLMKRAGSTFVSQIAYGASNSGAMHHAKNMFTHVINRSDDEQLMLVIGHDGGQGSGDADVEIGLWKLNGTATTTVNVGIKDADGNPINSADRDYFDVAANTDGNPYEAVTISDHTFIVNKQKTVAMKAVGMGPEAMVGRTHVKRGCIFIKEGSYNATYTVEATDCEGTKRTIEAKTSNSSHGTVQSGQTTNKDGVNDAKSDLIAEAIYSGLIRTDDSDSTNQAGSNILTTTSDDNANLTFNGLGDVGSADTKGAGRHCLGLIRITDGDVAPDGDGKCEFTLDGKLFKFSNATAGGTPVATIQVGANVRETAYNVAKAVNDINDDPATAFSNGIEAHVEWSVDEDTHIDDASYIYFKAVTKFTAGNFNLSSNAGATLSQSVDLAAGNDAASETRVANRIYFQKQGSVISWWAAFKDEATAKASSIAVSITDSYGETMTSAFDESTSSFAGLPVTAPQGFVLKIEGEAESLADDYYVKFEAYDATLKAGLMGGGQWVETLVGGTESEIDPNTMPWQLVRIDADNYTLKSGAWDTKTVGDTTSDPVPSFVGKTINDIFYHNSRLGILAGESVNFSELHDPYNFWRTTVTTSLDSDPIDISSSVNDIANLNFAVPFSNQLVIFSDRTQFLLSHGRGGLTPSTASLALVSRFENSPVARPVSNETSILFAQERSGSTAIYEMFPSSGGNNAQFTAVDISDHVPTYISGRVIGIRASSLASAVVVLTDSGDNAMYVYKYLNQGGQRVVSSWSKFKMACDYLKSAHFIGEKLHMIESHHKDAFTTNYNYAGASATTYEILSYTKLDNTDALSHSVDTAYTVPSSAINWNGTQSNKTVITMPWEINDNTPRKGNVKIFNTANNLLYTDDGTGSHVQIVVNGINLTDLNIVVGIKFDAKYVFSHQYLKRQSSDQKMMAVTDGRTLTRWVELYFNDTQHLKVDVTYPSYLNKTATSKTYTGAFDGGAVGGQPSETKSMRVMVASRNDNATITLSSETHQTATITGANFELGHTSRLTRIT